MATPGALPLTPRYNSSRAVKQDEVLGLHGDRRKHQHDHSIRKCHAVREQYAENTARCTDRRIQTTLRPSDNELHEASTDHAGKVVGQKSLLAHHEFQLPAEHPEAKHIEENMRQVAVQKSRR